MPTRVLDTFVQSSQSIHCHAHATNQYHSTSRQSRVNPLQTNKQVSLDHSHALTISLSLSIKRASHQANDRAIERKIETIPSSSNSEPTAQPYTSLLRSPTQALVRFKGQSPSSPSLYAGEALLFTALISAAALSLLSSLHTTHSLALSLACSLACLRPTTVPCQ